MFANLFKRFCLYVASFPLVKKLWEFCIQVALAWLFPFFLLIVLFGPTDPPDANSSRRST